MSLLDLKLRMVELEHREHALRLQHQALVRLEQQKAELASLIVHDLKSPLAAILPSAAYLLESTTLSTDEREAAPDIERSSQAMLRMVMNLLDVSRSDDGALNPTWTNVDVRRVLESVRQMATRRAEERGQKLVVSAAPDVIVLSVAELLRRVVANLVDNALKYGPSSGGTIRLDAAATSNGFVNISVCDEGPGVPEGHRTSIFDRYVRLEDDEEAAGARTSRGLGLSFCRLAIEALGGKIWVEDNLPNGSAFRIRLPTRPARPASSTTHG